MTSLPLSVRTSSIHLAVFKKVCRPRQQKYLIYHTVFLTELVTDTYANTLFKSCREITNRIWMPWFAIKGYTARVIEPIPCIILLLTYGPNKKKNDILLPQHTVFKIM